MCCFGIPALPVVLNMRCLLSFPIAPAHYLQVEFRISAMSVAAGVAAETPLAGRFSDNGLLVLPWAPPLLQFYANHDTTAAQVQQSLSLISIFAPASSPSS